jgi:23S rRNA (uracil1939-C5)-methyltransferase
MNVSIDKLIYGGNGLGRVNGKPIFVRKSVPGDKLKVESYKVRKDFEEAVIKEIIDPSQQRIKPSCPHFDLCGGCDYQNISYENQLKYKGEIFREVLARAKVNFEPEKIVPGSDQPFFYRNSIRFFIKHLSDGSITFARHRYDKLNELVEIKSCLLQSEISNELLMSLKKYINENIEHKSGLWQIKIREGKATGEFMVELITSDETLEDKEGIVKALAKVNGVKSIYHTVAFGKSLHNLKRNLIFGSPIIFERVGKYKFQISPESFFQTNSLGIKTLYDVIKQYADVKVGDKVLDLYCGTGTIGIYLCALAKEVIGVESVPQAIRDANDNAKINKIPNIKFICSDVSDYLSSLKTSNYQLATIIVDPPRAGLEPSIVDSLSNINFDRLVYVSCNPATFARDINLFEKHDIKLQKIQPIDMFPQTHHIECVGLLAKHF